MPAAAPPAAEPNRWAVLALVGVAQLMVILDSTIVNIALPSAQRDLGFSTENRQWVVTAYALAFGSLLLVGGKIGDLFGRKWTFIAGLIGFSAASFLGGLAPSFEVLVIARTLQGAFGALLAPSALSLLTVTFADSPDRAKAFGIFSAVATAGASVGLMLGGLLTDVLSWRWCLYVNLLIAIPAVFFALRLIVNEGHPQRPRIDFVGVVLACTGLFAIVFGFSKAATDAWQAPVTIVSLAAGVALLIAFVFTEKRVDQPLLPLHIVWDRARGGAYASIAIAGASVFAIFLFLTFFMQQNLGYSPLKTGVAFLPLTALIFVMAPTVQTQVLPRLGARPIIMAGMALGALAMLAFFAQLTPSSSYASRCPARPAHHGHRDAVHLRAVVWDRDARCRPLRGRRRVGDGQHLPAGGRRGRHRGALDDLRHRRIQLRLQPRAQPGAGRVRRGAWLHDSVLLRSNPVRDRLPRRRARAPPPHPTAPASGWRTGGGDGLGAICATERVEVVARKRAGRAAARRSGCRVCRRQAGRLDSRGTRLRRAQDWPTVTGSRIVALSPSASVTVRRTYLMPAPWKVNVRILPLPSGHWPPAGPSLPSSTQA